MTKTELAHNISQNVYAILKSQLPDIEEVRAVQTSLNVNTGKVKVEIMVGDATRKAWQMAIVPKKETK